MGKVCLFKVSCVRNVTFGYSSSESGFFATMRNSCVSENCNYRPMQMSAMFALLQLKQERNLFKVKSPVLHNQMSLVIMAMKPKCVELTLAKKIALKNDSKTLSQRKLKGTYGVSKTTVHNILKRKAHRIEEH